MPNVLAASEFETEIVTTKRTKDAKVSDIFTLNFVLFVTFVVS